MIFVPSVFGVSHSPREFTRPRDMAHGADVLLHTVLAIDRGALEQ
jgi:N-carbamoyl-L-amino-acid hydrolase